MDEFIEEMPAEHAKALEDALIAGEQSGEPVPFDTAAFRERMRAISDPPGQ